MRMVWGVVWFLLGSLGGVLGVGGVFRRGVGVRWGVVSGLWLVWGRVWLARRRSSRRPTLPDKPTTHWLETNKPSLHKTQCDSDWHTWAGAFDVAETNRLAKTLRSWEPELLAYSDTGLTNRPTEGINRIIKAVKRQGFGYTNADNYRIRVLYRCA